MRLLVSIGFLLSAFVAGAQAGEPYRLGPQDKLNVRVFEWQVVKGEVREWDAVGGSFTIGADGNLSVPLLGQIEASGRATAEIASDIGDRLQQRFGLSDRPDASVEVEEYRPFFIEGSVRNPGSFPFAPGLTVLQAFSLAGGLQERIAYGSRVSRDLINAAGTIEMLQEERARRLIQRARIIAEIGGTEIEVPAIPTMPSNQVAAIAKDEQAIKQARETRLERETSALEDLQRLLDKETTGLREKLVSLERQIDLAKQERDGVRSLKEKGLAVSARLISTETSVAELESRILDINTAILRAQQENSKAEQTKIGLRTSRDAELATERQQNEAVIGKLNTQVALQQGLRREAITFASATNPSQSAGVQPVYTIVRRTPEGGRTIEATADTPLAPGDVLQVRISLVESQ